jgi:acyl-CoA hydrolase
VTAGQAPPFPARATPAASRVETVHLVLPGSTNALGTIFGGIMMQWIDEAAAIAAARHAMGPVVTASMDRLHFLRPVRLGEVVIVQAQVNQSSRSSMEVGVRVETEDPRTRARVQATRAYLTFVAIDSAGRPREVEPVVAETPEDERRVAAANRRRKERLAERRDIEARGHE